MRGTDEMTGALFSYVNLEERLPARHPLRLIRRIVNDALAGLDAEFEVLYAKEGRPSIPPERLIRASLLQILFSIRSERQLMEQMDYNLLFRWFVGLGIDDLVWVPTVFTKNRDRLLTTDMSRKVMAAILAHPEVKPLLSDEHFSVDGTLVKAWVTLPPDPGPEAKVATEPGEADDQEDKAAVYAGIQGAGGGTPFRGGRDLREPFGGAGDHVRAIEDVAPRAAGRGVGDGDRSGESRGGRIGATSARREALEGRE